MQKLSSLRVRDSRVDTCGIAVQRGDVAFLTSAKQGFLESIKDTPRVGRRYVSMALLHLFFGGILIAKFFKHPIARNCAWGIAIVSVLSLALLDARAAYASLGIGLILLVGAIGIKRTLAELSSLFKGGIWRKVSIVTLVVSVGALGYDAGKSRWISMSYSVSAAASDVFNPSSDFASLPYVNKSYWDIPIDNIQKCYLEKRFRCQVDQSAYLRTAWLLEGVKSAVDHPFGIGYSDDYMGRLWGLAGDDSKYQRSDSFLIEHIVSFGVVGVILYAYLWWGVARTLSCALKENHAFGMTMMVIAGIIFVCVGRSLVDVFSEGLWRYLMALLGMYYGLLHSHKIHVRGK